MTTPEHIMAWVTAGDASAAIAVFEMRSPLIVAGQLYKLGQRTLRGLTRVMANEIWRPVKGGRGGGSKPRSGRGRNVAVLRPLQGSRLAGVTGLARGSIVHEQLAALVRHDVVGFMREYPEGAHPYALAVPQQLMERGILLIRCEVPVYSEERNLATRIDWVGVTRNGCLVVGETKTGYNAVGSFDRMSDGVWRARTVLKQRGGIACTPRRRAEVQCALGAWALVDNLRVLGVQGARFRCMLAHVNDMGVHLHEVPCTFLTETLRKTYDSLLPHEQLL